MSVAANLRERAPCAGQALSGARAGSPDRRPLYLGRAMRGRMDVEGPAFRVRAARSSDARFPFARISRIVSGCEVDWSAAALRACFGQGIPVIVVDGRGIPIGFLLPAQPRPSSFAEAMAELLDRPDWQEIYGCWLKACRMRALVAWRTERRARGEPVEAHEFATLVRRHVYGGSARETELFGEAAGVCRGALHAIAAQALLRWRLEPVFWAGECRLDLLADLAALLELRVRLEASAIMRDALAEEGAALRALEALGPKLRAETDRALLTLARRVREVLEQWR